MSLSLVPDSIADVFEWDECPVLCTGTFLEGGCGNPAVFMVRAEDHGCSHDGRFSLKCEPCLERYVLAAGYVKCERTEGHPRIKIVEVRELP